MPVTLSCAAVPVLDPFAMERLSPPGVTVAEVSDEFKPGATFAGASVGVAGESVGESAGGEAAPSVEEGEGEAAGGVNGAVWFRAGSGWSAVIALVT